MRGGRGRMGRTAGSYTANDDRGWGGAGGRRKGEGEGRDVKTRRGA